MTLKWIRCLFKGHQLEFVENCLSGLRDEHGGRFTASLWKCTHCGREIVWPQPHSVARELTPDEVTRAAAIFNGHVTKPAPWPPAPPYPQPVAIVADSPSTRSAPVDDGLTSMADITAMMQVAQQLSAPRSEDPPSDPFSSGQGGDYACAGTSGSWDTPPPQDAPAPAPSYEFSPPPSYDSSPSPSFDCSPPPPPSSD